MYSLIEKNFTKQMVEKLILDSRDYYNLNKGISGSRNDFERFYRKFWAMNQARLNSVYYEKYFNCLFSLLKKKKTFDPIKEIKSILEFDETKYQFSFATKLLHTVNNNLPVYDKYIGKFFLIDDHPKENKIDIYDFLITEYKRLYEVKCFESIIKEANTVLLKENIQISYAKHIDTILSIFTRRMEKDMMYRKTIHYK
jgi:hypothetical protein